MLQCSSGLLLMGVLTGCVAGPGRVDGDRFVRDASDERGAMALPAPTRPSAADEVGLAAAARVEDIVRVVLAQSPELAEIESRVRSALERVPAAGALPDPELKAEQWATPLTRPYRLDQAETLMLGVRQSFPVPGTRAARARAALEDAAMVRADLATRRLDLAAQVRRAFLEYLLSDRELAVHEQHVQLTSQLGELARARYAAARGTQQDVLRLALELARLHGDLIAVEQRKRSSAALLNALMGRAPDAALGPAVEPAGLGREDQAEHPGHSDHADHDHAATGNPAAGNPSDADHDHAAAATPSAASAAASAALASRLGARPELARARHAIARSSAELSAARAAAKWPTFMVGVDYMYMPLMGEHGYGAMLSMSLPWLSSRHRDEVRAAEHSAAAEAAALRAEAARVRFELADAQTRVNAAREAMALLQHDLAPQVAQALEAAEVAFGAGQGDALAVVDAVRTSRDVTLELERSRIRLAAALVDLDRALGTPPQGATP